MARRIKLPHQAEVQSSASSQDLSGQGGMSPLALRPSLGPWMCKAPPTTDPWHRIGGDAGPAWHLARNKGTCPNYHCF